MVLIVGLILSVSIFSFLRQSLVDSFMARNLEYVAAAETLAEAESAWPPLWYFIIGSRS